jgi:hypothetical protein
VNLADPIAAKVRTVGYILWFVALGLATWVIIRGRLRERAAVAISRPRATATPNSPHAVLDDEQMWG